MCTINPIINIRNAKLEDCQQIAKLFAQFDHPVNENELKKYFLSLGKRADLINLVAENNTIVVGIIAAIVVPSLHDLKENIYVNSLVIDHNLRSKGIGTTLLNAIEGEAKKRNCHYVNLVSGIKREQAHKFYVNNGFTIDSHKYFRKII